MWLFVRWKYHTTFYSLRYILDIIPPFKSFFKYFSKSCSPFYGCHHKQNLNKAVKVMNFYPMTVDDNCATNTTTKSVKEEFDQQLNSLNCCLPIGKNIFLAPGPELHLWNENKDI